MEIWKDNRPTEEWEYIGLLGDNLVYIFEDCVMLSREDFTKIKMKFLEAKHAKKTTTLDNEHEGV